MYEEQTEILVVQHYLFRQILSDFILMYYFLCVHIGLYVIMVCHVPYIDMPCMPGPIMNLTAVASVKSVSLINGAIK